MHRSYRVNTLRSSGVFWFMKILPQNESHPSKIQQFLRTNPPKHHKQILVLSKCQVPSSIFYKKHRKTTTANMGFSLTSQPRLNRIFPLGTPKRMDLTTSWGTVVQAKESYWLFSLPIIQCSGRYKCWFCVTYINMSQPSSFLFQPEFPTFSKQTICGFNGRTPGIRHFQHYYLSRVRGKGTLQNLTCKHRFKVACWKCSIFLWGEYIFELGEYIFELGEYIFQWGEYIF